MGKYTKLMEELNRTFQSKHFLDGNGLKELQKELDMCKTPLEVIQIVFNAGFECGTKNSIDLIKAQVEGFKRVGRPHLR